jgi:hypothetical protein
MSSRRLPAEILDHIVDHLHDTKTALSNCSLVSKSWIPRTRKHLFADIGFQVALRMRSWKKTFPDSATSPARYTKTLYIGDHVLTAGDAEVGSLLRDFSCVVHLEVGDHGSGFDTSKVSFAPFCGFSPILKSFRVITSDVPSSRIFNLILSFPLLEDLDIFVSAGNTNGSGEDEIPTAIQPSSSPRFTGSFELYLRLGMGPFARRLISLPGGIHFRKLTLTWLCEEDLLAMTALVEACAHTLESLDIRPNWRGTLNPRLCPHR